MTHIVNPSRYPTKKAFREAVLRGTEVYCEDPSIFSPKAYYLNGGENNGDLQEGGSFVVTNHPKRSWFAQVERIGGKLKVI